MKFESFTPKPKEKKVEQEEVDLSRRSFLRTAGGAATGAALTAAGIIPEDTEAFGASVSPEDFAKDYVDDLEVPQSLGDSATIKENIKRIYERLSPSQRKFYVMMMPGNCSGRTILQSFDPSTGSIKVICRN